MYGARGVLTAGPKTELATRAPEAVGSKLWAAQGGAGAAQRSQDGRRPLGTRHCHSAIGVLKAASWQPGPPETDPPGAGLLAMHSSRAACCRPLGTSHGLGCWAATARGCSLRTLRTQPRAACSQKI
eukprot:scaffold42970_cov49-Phaeocystis_antarctica.AAC.2